jgi:hypothetical protein
VAGNSRPVQRMRQNTMNHKVDLRFFLGVSEPNVFSLTRETAGKLLSPSRVNGSSLWLIGRFC